MSGIRGKNTRPEIVLRHGLHGLGFRYRLHGKLPGKPDLVFAKYRAVIFVHGCFWHKHECHLFKWPSTRRKFWRQKIEGNCCRDIGACAKLVEVGWRILTVWECAFKGRFRWDEEELIAAAANWLVSESENAQLQGHDD